ncbi:MAG: 23S rRNA pseudouridine2605 synthase [Planctomycetota bacterium]|jgi:23S rRNA pseudouridine2605 synthase
MSYARKKTAASNSSGPKYRKTTPFRKKSAGKKAKKSSGRSKRTIESREDGIRLNKYLAEHGLASRRAADILIAEGHVTVDGISVEEQGLKVDPATQLIEVDGEPLVVEKQGRKRYYLLNKPSGVVCTSERRETKQKAIDLITDRAKGRIYTVGRLDEDSKGLLILTNDGDFANRVSHPRFGVSKTYAVKLRGRIGDYEVQKVRNGVYLAEGRAVASRVVIRKRSREFSHLDVTLYEGKNREIRRIFHSVGFKVVELRRSHIGTLSDRKLKVGFWRYLEQPEIDDLLALSAGEEVAPTPRGRNTKKTTRRRAQPADSKPVVKEKLTKKKATKKKATKKKATKKATKKKATKKTSARSGGRK